MPTDSQKHTITRDQLAGALARWEVEAREEGWPDRTDPERHTETSDYLLGLIAAGRAKG